MRADRNISEKLERYILGEMPPREEEEFEKELTSSPELLREKEELELLIGTLKSLRVSAPSGFRKQLMKSVRKKRRFIDFVERELKWAALVAAVAILLLTGILVPFRRKQPIEQQTAVQPREGKKGYILQIEPQVTPGIFYFTVSEDNSM